MPLNNAEPGPAALRIDGLSHRYGKTVALDAIALEIPQGASVALVGPDGVGKSTLLGVIAGAKRIQAGRVEVLGGDMRDRRHRRKVGPRIAYMPQGLGRNLYPTLSVVENIDFFAHLFGMDPAALAERRARLLAATGLAPFPDRPAGKLSGGMKQKLGLCCALVHDPDLLILDEPTTGIDPLSRRQFWELIATIRADRPSMTMLVATAYMEEAEGFDQLLAIDQGRLLAAGPTQAVIAAAGAVHLDAAYVALRHRGAAAPPPPLEIPPRVAHDGAPAIVAEGLTRRFGDFVAVDHASFRIERGEIFGFLGSNGSGKTTTMKMLTGLLAANEGKAELLGHPVQAQDIATRLKIGYMSQGFSLYEELTVRANLALHARLYRIAAGEIKPRIEAALQRFKLEDVADSLPGKLPLGLRQRLQLAAACLHRPEILILDEPTSGVDPEARDDFWRLILELSRNEAVTIFISTHFMNEAERCDRISLMHRGRTLSVGTPAEIIAAESAASLEQAFIQQIARADPEAAVATTPPAVKHKPARLPLPAFLQRPLAFARRELIELIRDPVRLAFAFLGPIFLMITFGFGVSFDVDRLTYAVLDRDQSLESRTLLENFQGSRYFLEQAPLYTEAEIDRRLKSGELKMALEIPPDFGRDLLAGRRPEIGVYLDGSMPFRAETIRGYVEGIAVDYVETRLSGSTTAVMPVSIQPRFRYNQDFKSVVAIVPGTIMLLLMLIPAMLTAVGVVREKELGSIANLYVSPAGTGEFLIGKQLPYVLLGFIAFLLLAGLAAPVFGLLPKGSLAALALGGLLYVGASTSFGLLVSAFVRTQVAAIFAAAILGMIPTVNFSGLFYPTSTLEGTGRIFGMLFPASWFQTVSLGVFDKGLGFTHFLPQLAALAGFAFGFLLLARLLVRKQER
ncbi:ribosome-associated ATPase/putative transporter RbbA [Dongia sp.]|uniref:ribosome-associated ATPase/putative transporter RbbA n=1 Tax=Dongia sp. TaxID=1977262 RepID=UPI0037537E03